MRVPSISKDVLELGPVRARPIYQEPTKNIASKAMFNCEELNLWNNCESVLLEKNFRQGEGEWTQMLNRIRVGEQTLDDLKILENRPATLLSKKQYDDAIHLFFTNIEVNGHNNYMLNSLEEILEEISASVMHSRGYKPQTNENGLIDKTQFAKILKLKKSARVMIIANVDIRDSIVNGSLGTVIDFVKTVGKDANGVEKEEVRSIIVQFDDPEAGLDQIARHSFDKDLSKFDEKNGVPIFRSNLTYQVPYRNNYKEHGCQVQIKQFPLKLAWASTAHKVQGVTIKKGTNVVIHGHKNIPNGMYYLMFSRAEELQQIFLEMPKEKGKSEKIKLKIKADPNSLIENNNLVERSIVPSYKNKHFDVLMINIASLPNKIIDLQKDFYAEVSDHIGVVETWLETKNNYDFNMPGR